MARLVILRSADPAMAGLVVELEGFEFTLGREAGNALTAADPALSRHHARLLPEGDGWAVEDLGSGNGTFVNGERVTVRLLRHGDRLLVGETELAFEDAETTTLLPSVQTIPSGEATALRPLPDFPAPPPLPAAPSPPPPLPLSPPGHSIPAPAACPSCGRAFRPGARFCGGCGAALSVPPFPPAPSVMPPPIPSAPAASPRRTGLWLSLAAAAVLFLAAGAAVLFLRAPSRSHAPSGPAGPAADETTAPAFIPDPDFPFPPPLAVERDKKLASAGIPAAEGGTLSSGDGLTLTVPAGALDQDRAISIHSARFPGPALSAGVVGQETKPMEVLKTWDIDLGPETGLMPGEMELSLDVSAYPPERYPFLSPAIAADGRTWTRLPAERNGDTLIFTTRHCSPVCLLGLAEAFAVVLPIAAISYLVYDRVNEFPDRYNAHAPFLSVDDNPQGFEIYWSKKVPGADPATGFRDERGYLRELEKIAGEYRKLGGGGPTVAASRTHEILALKRQYLMPECVKQVADALAAARDYLKTRNIRPPLLTLPVYVVPTLDKNSGYIHNPWAGRRYMLLQAGLPDGTLNATALHELFHHYQTGYVWLDRTGHLPLMEASALLMEREAIPHYAGLKRPYNATEGLALAQFIAFRHGLEGPAQWKEDFVRSFGYGLTWFLEHLRDECWVGVLKKNKPEDFHAGLLKYWGSTKHDAIHKALVWAAGGSESSLSNALADFAQNTVLAGPVDSCGGRSPYGSRYNACPLSDSPYKDRSLDLGVGNATIDLAKIPAHTVDDAFIRPWSIQFLRFKPPGRDRAALAMEFPREWFPEKGRKRVVLVREGPGETTPTDFSGTDEAPPSGPSAWGSVPLKEDAFIYIVDTGQTGSGWISDFKPARFFLLEPPGDIQATVENGKLRLKWKPAESTVGARDYFAYADGTRTPPLSATGGPQGMEALVDPRDLPSWSGAEAPAVAMTSAVPIGKGEDGMMIYLESPRSDTVGGGNTGNYRMDLSLDAAIKTSTTSSPCNGMVHSWWFQGFSHPFPVQVGPDGAFTFKQQWKEKDPNNPFHFSVEGRGTFRGKEVRISGNFTATASFTRNESRTEIHNSGTFEGEGKFTQNIWLGHRVTGRFDASASLTYCLSATNNECQKWKTDRSECSGTLAPLLSSIDAFTRTP